MYIKKNWVIWKRKCFAIYIFNCSQTRAKFQNFFSRKNRRIFQKKSPFRLFLLPDVIGGKIQTHQKKSVSKSIFYLFCIIFTDNCLRENDQGNMRSLLQYCQFRLRGQNVMVKIVFSRVVLPNVYQVQYVFQKSRVVIYEKNRNSIPFSFFFFDKQLGMFQHLESGPHFKNFV